MHWKRVSEDVDDFFSPFWTTCQNYYIIENFDPIFLFQAFSINSLNCALAIWCHSYFFALAAENDNIFYKQLSGSALRPKNKQLQKLKIQ